MGLWLEILNLGAKGEKALAREKLHLDLPLSLREFVTSSQGNRLYRGPILLAVRRYIDKLPADERALVQSNECDFVDYILDDVCAEVERTLVLVELCHTYPMSTLAELQSLFPWASGLKRSGDWKRERIISYLQSFKLAGVDLPASIIGELTGGTSTIFEFNEIAYAVSPKRLEQSWKDFKQEMELGEKFIGILLEEDETSSAAEGLDFSAIPLARLADYLGPTDEAETTLELLLLGRALKPELTGLMEGLHKLSPYDGYRPIAWHNVFWNIMSEYDYLPLDLKPREPQQETDQELSDHLAAHYKEVKKTSRPVISRRRKKLYVACTEKVIKSLRAKFAKSNE